MIEPPGHVGYAGADAGLDGEELRPVDPAERLAEVGDAGWVEVAAPVPVDVHPDLDRADELHQVDHGLAKAVPAADEGLRRRRVHALGRVDRAVPVLVDPAAAGGERHGATRRPDDRERAERAAAVADDVDRDRRDPRLGHRGRDDERARALVVAEAVAEDRHGPAARRRRAVREEEVEVNSVRPLDGGTPVAEPVAGIHFPAVS